MLKIREKAIWPNVVASPMSGVTDRPFRRLLHHLAHGRVGMSVTEFVSVDSPPVLTPRHLKAMGTFPEEKSRCIQLFGGDPERMADAARRIQELGPDFIEINGGCPMPKVIGRGAGSNLLRDLPRLREMIQLTKKSITVPLLLKIRIGWDDQRINVIETARLAQEEGIELLTIHGRTRMQGYRGLADWEWIEKAAQSVSIPVMGNGDIHSAEEAWARCQSHSIAGVGIGRALMHNPWIMGQVADLWSGKPVVQPSAKEQLEMIHYYIELLMDDGYSKNSAIGRIKQIVARLTRYIEPDISSIRQELLRTETTDALLDRLATFYQVEYDRIGCNFEPGRVASLNGGAQTEIQEGCQFNS